ncbi:hypothetical protein AB9L15_04100 [Lysinibacillus fusiformis]|uniref:hypothetical protein n=1 Tax=Lysinibacillus fusiformis TaxID=28031 RepID=UPI0035C145D1
MKKFITKIALTTLLVSTVAFPLQVSNLEKASASEVPVTESNLESYEELESYEVLESDEALESVEASSFGIFPPLVEVKETKMSNQEVNEILKAAGLNAGAWGFLTALAKKWGKSPTWRTLMMVALPTLGAAGLNSCNQYNKGVIITDTRIGATHMYGCLPQE